MREGAYCFPRKVVEEAEVRRVSDGRCPLHRVLILGSAEVSKIVVFHV